MKEFISGIGLFFIGLFTFVVLTIGGLYLGSALNLITLPWQKFDAKVNMNSQIIQKTYNADNAIYNYHWFQERQASIVALDEQITTAHQAVVDYEKLHGDPSKWTFDVETEDGRLRSVEQGLKSERSSQTNEYNARASEADRSIFQNGLPLYINLN